MKAVPSRRQPRIRRIFLKAGWPTVEEARVILREEIDRAKAGGATVLKVIHGYGSTGVGGRLKPAIHAFLRRHRKEGAIRAFVPGEKWETFNDVSQKILDACWELRRDPDLNRYNEGITIVLL